MDIGFNIAKSIKEGKWLSIDYENRNGQSTSFWCAIKDISIINRIFVVTEFNQSKMSINQTGVINDARIAFESITRAEVVENTSYDVPDKLIEKIEKNLCRLKWLGYDLFDEKILNYLKDCIQYDNPPYQNDQNLISGIDENALEEAYLSSQIYLLNAKQISEVTLKFENRLKKDTSKHYLPQLIINLLSINDRKRGLFVIAYRNLTFDPSKMGLVIDKNISYNYEFLTKSEPPYKHSLRNYLDIETDEFVRLFGEDQEAAKDLLMMIVPRFKEEIVDSPYIMELRRNSVHGIEKDYFNIVNRKNCNDLSVPLQAFFGNMNKKNRALTRDFNIVLLDEKADVAQLRLIYNALRNRITYVQGPPGSGKTQTIINLVISAFFNNRTVLISSNNNKPINDILTKFKQIKKNNNTIPFPAIRLGNNSEIMQSIDTIRKIYELCKKFKVDEEKLNRHLVRNTSDAEKINAIIDKFEAKLELEERIDSLQAIYNSLESNINTHINIETDLINAQREYETIKFTNEEAIMKEVFEADQSFFTWLFYTSVKHIQRLDEPKYNELMEIIYYENKEDAVAMLNRYLAEKENFIIFQRIFPVILTTNQSVYRLGEADALFNLVIIDEAGQCEIGHSLSAIARGEQLLLLGDQKQLSPVITLDPKTNESLLRKHHVNEIYDYCKNSIIRLMQNVDKISTFILLNHHYRCHKDIINFSNYKYYDSQLIVKEQEWFKNKALFMIDVKQNDTPRLNERNASLQETEMILEDIRKNNYQNVGIITPFKNQADLLNSSLREEDKEKIQCGTIHSFQGDEKEVVYLSCAINSHTITKAFDWAKNNQELINVAMTRARKKFILVGDINEIKKRSAVNNDLHDLVKYVENNGKTIDDKESKATYISSAVFRQFNSLKEKQFLETLNHVMSFNENLFVRSNVKVNSVLCRYTTPASFDYGSKAEFDFVIYKKSGANSEKPILVVELNGDEHTTDKVVERRDKMKEKICRDNNIVLFKVQNDYARRYVYIKENIERILK